MNMFLKRVIYERGIPFDVKEPKPSKETIKALKEAEDIITGKVKAKGYKDINELRKALLSDD